MEVKRRIICHRGLWTNPEQWNSIDAIIAATSRGFGAEFDIRDAYGSVVLAHDPVEDSNNQNLSTLAALIESLELRTNFAINVKSDGLIPLLPNFRSQHFYFDMSVPEKIRYSRAHLPIAERVSEIEPLDRFDLGAPLEPLWIDGFESDWFIEPNVLSRLFQMQTTKVFVSPELHGRPYEECWQTLLVHFKHDEKLMICTDRPQEFYDAL